jgi:hypothetical protein
MALRLAIFIVRALTYVENIPIWSMPSSKGVRRILKASGDMLLTDDGDLMLIRPMCFVNDSSYEDGT